MRIITLEDYYEFLDGNVESRDDYTKHSIKPILKKEEITFDCFVSNFPYYKYKYLCFDNEKAKSTKRNQKAYFNKIEKVLLKPKPLELEFFVNTNNVLDLQGYIELSNEIDEIVDSVCYSFEKKSAVRIKKVERGSLIFTIVLSSVLLSIQGIKAINLIKRLIKNKNDLDLSKTNKTILTAAIIVLNIIGLLLGIGDTCIVSNAVLTIEVVKELLDQIKNHLDK